MTQEVHLLLNGNTIVRHARDFELSDLQSHGRLPGVRLSRYRGPPVNHTWTLDLPRLTFAITIDRDTLEIVPWPKLCAFNQVIVKAL